MSPPTSCVWSWFGLVVFSGVVWDSSSDDNPVGAVVDKGLIVGRGDGRGSTNGGCGCDAVASSSSYESPYLGGILKIKKPIYYLSKLVFFSISLS